ncbi:insecticidal delta-endotoxin Cry8Ea1 family protein [Streptomyces uncialis]|uniref:insecticidal delta-endotoxin Cry8Ea1 family protein n=1 Tax=Streptomyces uncialis TaxID=1048205 RepID=UPI0037A968FE
MELLSMAPPPYGEIAAISGCYLNLLWPDPQDPEKNVWPEIEERVKAVIEEELAKLWSSLVTETLENMRIAWQRYISAAKTASPEMAKTEFMSAHDFVGNNYSQFTDEKYGYQTLPLFAQMANLHLSLLHEGILFWKEIGFQEKDKSWFEIELEEAVSKYCKYVVETYETAVGGDDYSLNYAAEMWILAYEYAHYIWPQYLRFVGPVEDIDRDCVVYKGPFGDPCQDLDDFRRKHDPRDPQPMRHWYWIGVWVKEYGIRGMQVSDGEEGADVQGTADGDYTGSSLISDWVKLTYYMPFSGEPDSPEDHGVASLAGVQTWDDDAQEYRPLLGELQEGFPTRTISTTADPDWVACDIRAIGSDSSRGGTLGGTVVGFRPSHPVLKVPDPAPLQSDCLYTLIDASQGLRLDLALFSTAENIPVTLRGRTTSDSQLWQLQDAGDETWRLVNAHNGQALALRDGSPVTIGPLQDSEAAQSAWRLEPAKDRTWRLTSPAAGGLPLPGAGEGDHRWILRPVPLEGHLAHVDRQRPALRSAAHSDDSPGLALELSIPKGGAPADDWELEIVLPAEVGTDITASDGTVAVRSVTAEERGTRLVITPGQRNRSLAPGDTLRFTLDYQPVGGTSPGALLPGVGSLNGVSTRS